MMVTYYSRYCGDVGTDVSAPAILSLSVQALTESIAALPSASYSLVAALTWVDTARQQIGSPPMTDCRLTGQRFAFSSHSPPPPDARRIVVLGRPCPDLPGPARTCRDMSIPTRTCLTRCRFSPDRSSWTFLDLPGLPCRVLFCPRPVRTCPNMSGFVKPA